MTATDRITLVVLNDNGTREKFTLSSWVGIPRKHELLWIGDDPFMVIEVEYAVSEGFFGARAIEAAGVYVRRLDERVPPLGVQSIPSQGAGELILGHDTNPKSGRPPNLLQSLVRLFGPLDLAQLRWAESQGRVERPLLGFGKPCFHQQPT